MSRIPPFDTFIGHEFSLDDDGQVVVSLELEPHHMNLRGVPHGGVMTSLLDSALGAAVVRSIPKEWWCATTSLSTQFIGGVREGTLIGRGRVVRRGRSVAFAAGEVRNADGKLLASATGTWHLWPYKPGTKPGGGPWVRMAGRAETIPVGKILCVGRNYSEHVAEMGYEEGAPPVLFFKPPSALIHDGGTLQLPEGGGTVHHEVELVIVIGTPGRAIDEANALDHVLGYGVGIDMTLREVQAAAKKSGEPWCVAKGFDGSAPISDIVPATDLGDASGLAIKLEVNGETRQTGNTSQMTRSVASLISHASRWITLERGDLIYTGTPAGVGPVVSGDRLEATIERIGAFRIDID